MMISTLRSLKRDIKNLLKDFADTRKLRGAILVAIENDPVCFESFGFADQSTHSNCTSNTQYLIASITKQFTAVAVLRTLYEKALVNTENLDLIKQKIQEDLHRPIGTSCRKTMSFGQGVCQHGQACKYQEEAGA